MSKSIQEIPYKTLRNLPEIKGMETGTKYDNEYGYVMDHRYIVGLEKTGEVNRYEKIQMHADECKIETILAKAAVDPSILQQRKGVFADITGMPTTLAEFKNMEIKIINEWNKLSADEKAKFDNSPDKFVAEFGTEEWSEKMGLKSIEDVKEAIEDVTPIKTEEGGEVNE